MIYPARYYPLNGLGADAPAANTGANAANAAAAGASLVGAIKSKGPGKGYDYANAAGSALLAASPATGPAAPIVAAIGGIILGVSGILKVMGVGSKQAKAKAELNQWIPARDQLLIDRRQALDNIAAVQKQIDDVINKYGLSAFDVRRLNRQAQGSEIFISNEKLSPQVVQILKALPQGQPIAASVLFNNTTRDYSKQALSPLLSPLAFKLNGLGNATDDLNKIKNEVAGLQKEIESYVTLFDAMVNNLVTLADRITAFQAGKQPTPGSLINTLAASLNLTPAQLKTFAWVGGGMLVATLAYSYFGSSIEKKLNI